MPTWSALALLLGAALAAYLPALSASFQFDDYNVIVDNPAVHGLAAWWASMPGIRPLLKLSYAANWQYLPGAAAFHGVNLALHLGNVVLAYLLLRQWARLTGPDWAEPGRVAFVGALLFALHPANTEVATYVAGRSVGLMALFYLGALLAVLGTRADAVWRPRAGLAAGLYLLALASKEVALILPLALAWVLHCAGRPIWRSTRPVWLALPLAGLALAALGRYRELLATSLETRSVGDNLLTQIDGLHYLVTRPFLGLIANIDPDIAASPGVDLALVGKLAPHLLLILIALAQARRRPWLGLGIAWFYLHLAPTNSLLARLDVANDRQLYLALLGPAFLLGIAAQRLDRRVAGAGVVALALLLGNASLARNREYRDEISLWRATVAASPRKARPWNNLGYAYYLAGRYGEARLAYMRALALDPGYAKARANLEQLPAMP
jgi:hypothetical protein